MRPERQLKENFITLSFGATTSAFHLLPVQRETPHRTRAETMCGRPQSPTFSASWSVPGTGRLKTIQSVLWVFFPTLTSAKVAPWFDSLRYQASNTLTQPTVIRLVFSVIQTLPIVIAASREIQTFAEYGNRKENNLLSRVSGLFINIASPSVAIGMEKSISSSRSSVIDKSAITMSTLSSVISSTDDGFLKHLLISCSVSLHASILNNPRSLSSLYSSKGIFYRFLSFHIAYCIYDYRTI